MRGLRRLSPIFSRRSRHLSQIARVFFSLCSFYLRPHYIAFESPTQAMRLGAPFSRNHLKRTEIEMPSRSTWFVENKRKVMQFYRRTIRANFYKFPKLCGAITSLAFNGITFKLGKLTYFYTLFPVVPKDFPQLVHVKSWKNRDLRSINRSWIAGNNHSWRA